MSTLYSIGLMNQLGDALESAGFEPADVNKLRTSSVLKRVKEEICSQVKNVAGTVKLISGAETLELDETDGQETIQQARDTFNAWIGTEFDYYGCDVKSEPTKKTRVSIYELIKHGTFSQIFGGMSDDLNGLCLSQPQIIQFVQKHRHHLRAGGHGNFFLFKVRDEFLVAHVSVGCDGSIGTRVDRLSHDGIADIELSCRVVVPQQ